MLNKLLFSYVDNSSLIVFRIIFGLLCFMESVGAILTGWVKRVMINPEFTFSFIGFEWLQPLPNNWMYAYYLIMGLFGIFIMLGYRYRLSMMAFTIMWSVTYLMQKTSYNNHYYLLMLLGVIMMILPANTYASLDARRDKDLKAYAMPMWCKWIFVLQLFIVYTYASAAKLYPDWLDTTVIEILMRGKAKYMLVGDLLQQKWLHYVLTYGGIIFDGLIIPLLLFRSTRKWAFCVSIVFHLFNSFIFQIGIFPYLSLAFTLFFFEPITIHKIFLKHKPFYDKAEVKVPSYKKSLIIIGSIYFIIQLILPLRHHFIQDNVLWTEEGHRLSWRMMLRSRAGNTTYRVLNKETQHSKIIDLDQFLTKKQQRAASTKPDIIWQFAQRLKEHYKLNGQDVSVFVDAKVSVNGNPHGVLIDPEVDLANVPWSIFKHSSWILPYNLE